MGGIPTSSFRRKGAVYPTSKAEPGHTMEESHFLNSFTSGNKARFIDMYYGLGKLVLLELKMLRFLLEVTRIDRIRN